VEHGGDADARAEMARVSRDGQHGLGCCPEQEIVSHRFVVKGDVGNLSRDGEDDVEIADREQIGLARGQPFPRLRSLTSRAMAVTTTYVDGPGFASNFLLHSRNNPDALWYNSGNFCSYLITTNDDFVTLGPTT
jgi:hypothetical protein